MAKRKKRRVQHSAAKKRYLAALTDPTKGKRRLSMEEAVKKANKKYPQEKITNVQASQSMVCKFRKTNANNEDQWNEMLEAGAKLRETKKLVYAAIVKELKRKYSTNDVPHAATLSAFCRRKGIENGAGSNGMSDKPILTVGEVKFFHSPRKGKVLVEMPKDRANKFLLREANLEG